MPHLIPRGLLRHVIVRLLLSGDMTGSDIMRILDERSEGFWRPSPGSIYPLLSSLEDEGIIKTVKTEGRSKTYSLSKGGRSRIKEILRMKHDVEHKARLNRMIWIQLLEPADRAHFHIMGMKHAIGHLNETIGELSASERKKLRTTVESTVKELASLLETLQQGET